MLRTPNGIGSADTSQRTTYTLVCIGPESDFRLEVYVPDYHWIAYRKRIRDYMYKYLENSEFIDWQHPLISEKASRLSSGCLTDEAVAKNCFEFVRDEIKHSWDYRLNPVTCAASDVLIHGTEYCYAKSHLLAALLRANGIPTGICYQRLTVTDKPPYCLHGLNAVHLKQYGWYRMDARGNKVGISAEFCPPKEMLAFPIVDSGERDLPEIWNVPHPLIVQVLLTYKTVEQVYENLPDLLDVHS